MRIIILILIAVISLVASNHILANELTHLKCSGVLSTTHLILDNSEKSRTENHGIEVIGMTIDGNKIRLSGGDAVFSLLMPKTEFSICKAHEVIEFYAINDQNCKLTIEKKSLATPTDFYSGEYNRILDSFVISRQRNDFILYKDSEIKTQTITTGGEFHCEKVKL
ncbi:hypothetical protein [Methylotenera sp.]|uniref:hypothetical protein n=1 Tax=Methylotenera sp. TaxID=2051956 RepID=UPI002487C670|nr:hypothetical protein [Methylotenera sp.]MDI1360775.1 hypothetical protein [Methylotenera sp.]